MDVMCINGYQSDFDKNYSPNVVFKRFCVYNAVEYNNGFNVYDGLTPFFEHFKIDKFKKLFSLLDEHHSIKIDTILNDK